MRRVPNDYPAVSWEAVRRGKGKLRPVPSNSHWDVGCTSRVSPGVRRVYHSLRDWWFARDR